MDGWTTAVQTAYDRAPPLARHCVWAAEIDDDGPGMDAREYLTDLVGQTIETFKGRPNKVIAVEINDVIVGTQRSPAGKPVPIAWIQVALDRLIADGEVEVSVKSLGHRSAFLGAVLASLPDAEFAPSSPPTVRWRRRGVMSR
jgi:hypothetical protein